MTNLDTPNSTCVTTLKLLGDFWTLRIVDALTDRPLHFCALQRAAGDVNPATLTTKLKKLEEAGVIVRKQESRTAVTYALSGLGKKIIPVLIAVNDFAKTTKTA